METQEIQTAQEVQETKPEAIVSISDKFFLLSIKDKEAMLDTLQKFVDEQRIGFTWKRLWNKLKGVK